MKEYGLDMSTIKSELGCMKTKAQLYRTIQYLKKRMASKPEFMDEEFFAIIKDCKRVEGLEIESDEELVNDDLCVEMKAQTDLIEEEPVDQAVEPPKATSIVAAYHKHKIRKIQVAQ